MKSDGPLNQGKKLKIILDEDILYDNKDLYILIIGKHLALERYYCYHKIQKLMKNKKKESEDSGS